MTGEKLTRENLDKENYRPVSLWKESCCKGLWKNHVSENACFHDRQIIKTINKL